MALTQNQWGFSVEHDNPFEVFPYLQEVARGSVPEGEVIDLSRGDPGYGFTPSVAGREFFGYLMLLDAHLNNWDSRFSRAESDRVWKKIVDYTHRFFSQRAQFFLDSWHRIFSVFEEISRLQGVDGSRAAVLTAFFQNCVASGGSYLDPAGQPLFRGVVAWHHQRVITQPVDFRDVVFVHGASHAIGTIFKALGEEGNGYLKAGDSVLIASPAYSPYTGILEHRGINVIPLSLDPVSGLANPRSLNRLATLQERIKLIVFIDPNNPTGGSASSELLQIIANLAKKHDSLIVTDEVYSDFFPIKHGLIDICPERVLRIHARSKIERSTGLRFGDILINKQAQAFLHARFGVDFLKYFINAKAPGGVDGAFFHTTFVPGPVQALGVLHMILGRKDRDRALLEMQRARNGFYTILDLPHQGNMYYSIFDLNGISGNLLRNVSIEEKLISLAKRGVIYIPAYRFFHENDRAERDLTNMVRASFVNATPEKVRLAAEITKSYLTCA